MEEKGEEVFDFLILGAGPAGLQMGFFLKQKGLNYLILEASSQAGRFFTTFPRHRKLISINKVHTGYDHPEVNLRWDWNSLLSDNPELLFTRYSKEYFPSAEDFLRYLTDYAEQCELNIRYSETVIRISRDRHFVLTTQSGHCFESKVLIVATGLSKPYIPSIPGIELAESYFTVSTDPQDFVNKRVLIIGKGNSAFETGNNLVGTAAAIHLASPSPIKMAWASHYVGHLRACNNNLLDTYQLKSQNAIIDARIERIDRYGERFNVTFAYAHAEGECEEIEYDHIILCTGFRFDADSFDDSCKPALTLTGRFPAMASNWESTNIVDLYFAGTLMQMRDFKKQMSGFVHGFRYNIRTLSRILALKYQGTDLPHSMGSATAKDIGAAILNRINHNSGLWQQPGFLFDLVSLDRQINCSRYYEELPLDYLREHMLTAEQDHFTISLEYGNYESQDPFNVSRIERTNTDRAADSKFLHPIIRHYYGSSLLEEHHIIEDLAAEWCEPEHILPLMDFLAVSLREKQGKDKKVM